MIEIDPSDIDLSDIDLGVDGWRKPGIPHRGWTCIDVIDSKEDDHDDGLTETCEMCGTMIRYVHVMTHPEYEGAKRVGRICAASMTGDYVGAKARERTVKRRNNQRRRAWNNRRSKMGWTVVEFRGYQIAVCEQAPHEGRIFLNGREEGRADGFASVREAVWSAFKEIDE